MDSSAEQAGRLPAASDHPVEAQKIQHEVARMMIIFNPRGVRLESDFTVGVRDPQRITVRPERVLSADVGVHL